MFLEVERGGFEFGRRPDYWVMMIGIWKGLVVVGEERLRPVGAFGSDSRNPGKFLVPSGVLELDDLGPWLLLLLPGDMCRFLVCPDCMIYSLLYPWWVILIGTEVGS